MARKMCFVCFGIMKHAFLVVVNPGLLPLLLLLLP